jgi:DNA (cytosine-5)-methyltransferase 1
VTLRALDVFCNAGGASRGYAAAGYAMTGVDLAVMPNYPFLDVIQGDALAVLADVEFCRGFHLIHASPPCQAYTALQKRWKREHPRLIESVRDALELIGRPYVIENVVGAPLRAPLMLCGSMFGLGVDGATLRRHRLFEIAGGRVEQPADGCAGRRIVGVYGTGGAWTRTAPGGGGVKVSGAAAAAALGVDWTSRQANLAQMLPPSYTEYLGRALAPQLDPVS